MNNIFFDTNAVLYFLADKEIKNTFLADIEITISFITEIELLCYPNLSVEEEENIKEFLENINIVNINDFIKEKTIFFRKKYNIKIPDAIIISSSYMLNIPLVSNDKQLLKELLKGSSIAFVLRVIGIIAGYIFTLLITRGYGAEAMGVFAPVENSI
jgi:predicted nucleic acid-binding protein